MITGPILRIIFLFPTFLYAVSIAVRAIIRSGRKEQLPPDRKSSADKRNFTFSIFADCLALILFNGFIIIFGVGQIMFGIAVTTSGVLVSIFGMSSLFTETDWLRELFLTIANIVVLGEVLDFASYSYIAASGFIAALVALLLYYTLRISGEVEIPAV